VFRDLAATGRDRLALFGSRVVGAGLVLLPIVLALAAVTAVASIVLAGSLAAPGAGAIATGTAMLLAAGALGTVVAVGLAAVVGSRGPVIAIMLAFALAIAPALAALGFLGDARAALPTEALDRIAGLPVQVGHTTVASASAVLVAWAAAAFAAGAWRTRHQEI
jgi:hypothetical protein